MKEKTGERLQIAGVEAVEQALREALPICVLLARSSSEDPRVLAVVEKARAQSIEIYLSSDAELRRLGPTGMNCDVLALVGPTPLCELTSLCARPGALWLLSGVAYPGNTGFAIRTAEVSGAAGIAIDAAFEGGTKRDALRASMGAHRFFPVLWENSQTVIAAARAAGRRIMGIEDSGAKAPWETDLRGPALFAIGGERKGIAEAVLRECDEIVRIPMAGFIPSYNLQAAVATIASERLRQAQASRPNF